MDVFCEKCNHKLPYIGAICPQCGSRLVSIGETFELDDLGGENDLKDRGITIVGDDKVNYKSKKHPHYKTFFMRREWNYTRGEYVIRLKDEDRLRDAYREKIVSKDGECIRDVAPKLSEHRNRGTAKKGGDKK